MLAGISEVVRSDQITQGKKIKIELFPILLLTRSKADPFYLFLVKV